MDTTRATLLFRIRNRDDAAAWSEFDAIYRPMLHRFARCAGLDVAAGEDIVQDCMVAIHRHIDSFEYDPGRGRFKGWLRSIVRSRVTDLFRARRERQGDTAVFDAAAASTESLPDEVFDKVWRQAHLRYCLDSLNAEFEPRTMEAFRAVVIDERPVEEICARLGLTPNQMYGIRWRVTNRLRQRMRELLDEDV
jgi:RNA polymerase sigma-70 factor (ECF subfamily)